MAWAKNYLGTRRPPQRQPAPQKASAGPSKAKRIRPKSGWLPLGRTRAQFRNQKAEGRDYLAELAALKRR